MIMKREVKMKSNNQTTISLSNADKEPCELYSKELAKIHRNHHPQENDLLDMVDDKYKYRLFLLLGVEAV